MLYDRIAARRNAPFHVQVELTDLPTDPPENYVRIGGAVVRVFRSDGTLNFGDSVSFEVWVCSRGKEPTGPRYVYHQDLVGMGHVEAYLDGKPPDCGFVGYEYTLVPGPSEQPTLTLGELNAARKWWQFWKS